MDDLANLLLSSLVVFGASAFIALGLGFAFRRVRGHFIPPINAKLRLRTGSAVYRCRFLGEGPMGWNVSAPLQRDAYVPIEVGQIVSCEATTDTGVALFDTRVRSRKNDPATGATLVLEAPRQVRQLNRRDDPRIPAESNQELTLDGHPVRLLDRSEGGARVHARHAPPQGSRVLVRLPEGTKRRAQVLEVETGIGGYTIRLKFEDAA